MDVLAIFFGAIAGVVTFTLSFKGLKDENKALKDNVKKLHDELDECHLEFLKFSGYKGDVENDDTSKEVNA